MTAWQTYTLDFNLTEAQVLELFSGPAFLPWNRMVRIYQPSCIVLKVLQGNIRGWGGPLPSTFIEGQRHLQHKILKRMREFGMTPVSQT